MILGSYDLMYVGNHINRTGMTIDGFMLVFQPKRPALAYQCKDFPSQNFNTDIDMWCTFLNLITLSRGLNEDEHMPLLSCTPYSFDLLKQSHRNWHPIRLCN